MEQQIANLFTTHLKGVIEKHHHVPVQDVCFKACVHEWFKIVQLSGNVVQKQSSVSWKKHVQLVVWHRVHNQPDMSFLERNNTFDGQMTVTPNNRKMSLK